MKHLLICAEKPLFGRTIFGGMIFYIFSLLLL